MITCPNCGVESPDSFRFCPHCGASLAKAHDEPPRVERKVVTVLFCDLAGFTSRSDQADPEDVRALLLPFHALAKQEIERFGGTLDKFIGDAAMGVFGWPAAHEDDPERAVRAALAILGGVAALNAERPDEPLMVRVGVNTGEAAVTLAAGVQLGENVAGDVVNTASRLQTHAPLGSAIVGEPTYRATRNVIDYEAMEPVTVKGKAQPLAVWRAVAARGPVGARQGREHSTPFVGRERERARLDEIYQRAVEQRRAQLVTVVAEPGAGKSRLVAEFQTELEAGGHRVGWHQGRTLPYGEGVTFWPLSEIVKSHAGILESDAPGARAVKLEAALQPIEDDAERAWLHARLAPLAGLESAATVERDEAFAAWTRFLEAVAVASGGPVAIVIEDVHWAERPMLEFMDHLVAAISSVPMLVIATARPELYDRHPEWREERPNAFVIPLSPLSAEETTRLVSGLLQSAALPPQTGALLLDRAGGNPLYAEEFVRMLSDRGLIDRRGRLTSDIAGLSFPDSLQALIAARLDTLPPGRKEIVQDACVIGQVFWRGAVAFLGNREEPQVEAELTELSRKELVRPQQTSSIERQSEYAFWHALVRDVGYGQIPRAARSAKHRLAVRWTEDMAGERIADHADVLAYHATSALELARAARVTDGMAELEDTARRYLTLAGNRAMALDVAKAEANFRRALDLTPEGDPDRPRIEAGLGEVALHGGRFDEADQWYRSAGDGLRRQGATAEAADAMVRLSVVTEYRGDPATSRSILGEAIDILSAMPPGPRLARALAESAGSLLATGLNTELVEKADRAIELAASTGEIEAEIRTHGFRGYARTVLGDLGGLEEQRLALERGLELGFARSTAVAYSNLGSALIHAEGPAAAMEVFRRGMAFSETRGLRGESEWFRNLILTPLIELGEWEEVLRLAPHVAEDARRRGAHYEEVYAEADRATVLSRREGAEAGEEVERVLVRAREIGDAPLLFGALLSAGRTRLSAEDLEGALAVASEVFDITRGDALTVRAGDVVHPVDLAARAGDVDLAERMLEGIDEFPLPKHQHGLVHARGIVAEGRGRLDDAAHGYQEAARRWEAFGLPYERGLALFGAGRCLTARNRSEAFDLLAEARRVFGALGAKPLVAEVDRVLQRAEASERA